MQMLEGTFGKGFAYYSEHSRTLSITPDSIFKGSKNYHVSDIMSLQQLDANSKKKIGETFALGGAGMLVGGLFGPLGGLAGLAAGAMAGGNSSHIVFGVALNSGDNFLFSANAKEYFSFQTDVSAYTARQQTIEQKKQERLSISASDSALKRISELRTENGTQKSVESQSVEQRLKKLKNIFEKNFLTQEEYEVQRQRILSEL